VNVLFFKYFDENGHMYVSAKTKGSATLNNTPYGNFLEHTKQCLFGGTSVENESGFMIDTNNPPPALKEFIERQDIQSISMELCGRKEPHLVLYDFDLALKPLFMQHFHDGLIEPVMDSYEIGKGDLREFTTTKEMCEYCLKRQRDDFDRNDRYRKERNLEIRYEYEYFINEGAVLYILFKSPNTPQSNFKAGSIPLVCQRKLYKVKPKDIEEVHWGVFDEKQKRLIEIAITKLQEREKPFSKETLIEELDIGPKEFSRYGREIMQYATEISGRTFNRKSYKKKDKKK